MSGRLEIERLKSLWMAGPSTGPSHYSLAERVGATYVGRSKSGAPAVVVELAGVAGAASRAAAGFELLAYPALECRFGERVWTTAAAVLECSDGSLADAFSVFAADMIDRIGDQPTWTLIVEIVEEWLALLRPRPRLTPERELGLWAELWLIHSSDVVDRLLAAWRGPEGDAVDFIVEGHTIEVKASQVELQHHVSLDQVRVASPLRDAWLLSLWVRKGGDGDPSIADLVEQIESTCGDLAATWKRLASAGIARTDASLYTTRYGLRSEPAWFAMADVPRIREADPGISQVRYRVALDPDRRADRATESELWRKFIGRDYSATT